MSTSTSAEAIAEKSPAKPARLPWFPILWPSSLAGIWAFAWYWFEDRGYPNSAIHAAVIFTVMGWAGWTILCSNWAAGRRWGVAGLLLGMLAAFYFRLLPFELINNGDVGIVGVRWRWAEPDRDLDTEAIRPGKTLDWQSTPHDYPNFLGDGYWAEVLGVMLESDWQENPPTEMWRQRIGAGWSSFALVGDYAVTQEQRGENELVTCYEIRTGNLMWTHADKVRFDPEGGGSLGGVGPQATPTVYERRVYTHGPTGIVNCLDATTGALLWSHDTVEEFQVENLIWGKASSPIVVGELVVVSVGDARANTQASFSQEGNSLVAFDRVSGEVVWKAGDRRSSYATPVLTTLAGTQQIIVVNEDFVTSQRAEDGVILWEHPWPGKSDGNASTSQPVLVGGDRLFLSKGYGIGSQLVQVVNEGQRWHTETIWKQAWMKTKLCNVVIRDGYVYGLDDVNLLCIDLATGKKRWKKRREPGFGHGQIMLIGDVILLLTEAGELLLVEASPDKYQELAAIQALDPDLVTWNNPAFSSPYLLVRNAEEMACYELPVR
jgi:outer membrane protein assembly factor BamB